MNVRDRAETVARRIVDDYRADPDSDEVVLARVFLAMIDEPKKEVRISLEDQLDQLESSIDDVASDLRFLRYELQRKAA